MNTEYNLTTTILTDYLTWVDNNPDYDRSEVVKYALEYWGTNDIYADAHHCESCDQPSKNGYEDYDGHDFCKECFDQATNKTRFWGSD
jgi:hypothetical protein